MKFIVTAGGQGKKLWPYSRVTFPKQFQKLIGEKSLFQVNVETLLKEYPAKDIFISTKKQYFKIASFEAPKIPKANFIIEPDIPKDRGPAEGLAFLKLSMLHPKEPFMMVQADTLRVPDKAFLSMTKTMEKLVKRDKKYITGGIKALNPVMGNDYLEIGDRVETKSNIEIYKAVRFLGRSSDYAKTKKTIEDFHAVLHSNHGCWYPELMLEAYKKYRSDWYEALMKLKKVIGAKNEEAEINKIYSGMEKGATEEVTKHVMPEGYVVLLPFKWTDIGTWGSYYDFYSKDGEVCGEGKVVSIRSRKSLVKVNDPKKLVVLYNIDNLIVIDSGDVLLVLPREDEANVNTIVDELEKRGMKEFI